MQNVDVGILVPVGRLLLLGSFGYCLMQAIRNEDDLQEPFEGLVIGILALLLYRPAAQVLDGLSTSMMSFLETKGGAARMLEQLKALYQAIDSDPKHADGTTSGVWPALKLGVWSVLVTITQFAFVCVDGVLLLAKKVLWQLLLILFPLAAGVYPLFPAMVKNLGLYAIELSLWGPILFLIDLAAAAAIRTPEIAHHPLGLGVVVAQILTIALILFVPSVTHRFMSGAFSQVLGAGGGATHGTRRTLISLMSIFRPTRIGTNMKRILPFGIFLFGAQAVASSSPALQLQPGFVYKLKCQGRLLVSAVGSDTLLQLEALPKELGCGALLKPLAASGRSNIILETSTGTIVRSVEIAHRTSPPTLELELGKGVQQ